MIAMCRVIFIEKPCPMKRYTRTHGAHFNDMLCDFAVSHLKNKNGSEKHFTAKDVVGILANADCSLDEDSLYDITFLANWFYSDFYPHAMSTETTVVKAACEYVKDPDGYEGQTLYRWADDMQRKDISIPWDDMI